jgi:lysophospholipase L1-like esterase
MDHPGGPHPSPSSWPASRLHVLPPQPPKRPAPRPRRNPTRSFGRRAAFTAAAASSLAAGAWTFSALRPSPTPPARRLPAARPLLYAAIGASDAVGYGLTNPRRDAWVPQLADQLPQPSQLLNLAIPGATVSQALAQQLPRAIEAKPHLVTVWLVVNDVLEGVPIDRYAADLDALLSRLRASTTAVVAIANAPLPPASLDPRRLPEVVRRGAALAWNTVINTAATKHNAVLVDLYEKWRVAEHPEYIGPDGLHPTVTGNRALAAAFATTLRETGVI